MVCGVPLLHHFQPRCKAAAVQLDVIGQEFLGKIVPLLVKNLLDVTADNGFIDCS